MPLLQDYEDEKKKQEEQPLQAGTLATGFAGPSAASPATGAGPAQGQGVPQGQANFASYFAANKGAADAMASKTAGGINDSGSKVVGDLSGRVGSFNAGLSAGVPDWARPTPLGSTKSSAGGIAGSVTRTEPGAAPLGQVMRPPPAVINESAGTQHGGPAGSVTADEAGIRAGTRYTGPSSLSEGGGWDELVRNATKTQGQAQQTGSEGGLQALQQEQQRGSGGPYGKGASRFDAGLSQASGSGQFDALRARFGGLANQVSDANTRATGQAADASRAVAGAAGSYGAALAAQPPAPAAGTPGVDQAAADDATHTQVTAQSAGSEDPDTWWGGQPDPVWGSITSGDAAAIQQARNSMSPQAYRDWLRTFKAGLKAGHHQGQQSQSKGQA